MPVKETLCLKSLAAVAAREPVVQTLGDVGQPPVLVERLLVRKAPAAEIARKAFWSGSCHQRLTLTQRLMTIQVALYFKALAAVTTREPVVQALGDVRLPPVIVQPLLVQKAHAAEITETAFRPGRLSMALGAGGDGGDGSLGGMQQEQGLGCVGLGRTDRGRGGVVGGRRVSGGRAAII